MVDNVPYSAPLYDVHSFPLLLAAQRVCEQRDRLCDEHREWLKWMGEAHPHHVTESLVYAEDVEPLVDVVRSAPDVAAKRLVILSQATMYHHARFEYARDKEACNTASLRTLCAVQRELGRAEGRAEAHASRAAQDALAFTAAYAERLERIVASAALASLSKG
jgi:hypothetical protein